MEEYQDGQEGLNIYSLAWPQKNRIEKNKTLSFRIHWCRCIYTWCCSIKQTDRIKSPKSMFSSLVYTNNILKKDHQYIRKATNVTDLLDKPKPPKVLHLRLFLLKCWTCSYNTRISNLLLGHKIWSGWMGDDCNVGKERDKNQCGSPRARLNRSLWSPHVCESQLHHFCKWGLHANCTLVYFNLALDKRRFLTLEFD